MCWDSKCMGLNLLVQCVCDEYHVSVGILLEWHWVAPVFPLYACTCQCIHSQRLPTRRPSWLPPALQPQSLSAPPVGSTQTLHHGNGQYHMATASQSHADSSNDHHMTAGVEGAMKKREGQEGCETWYVGSHNGPDSMQKHYNSSVCLKWFWLQYYFQFLYEMEAGLV